MQSKGRAGTAPAASEKPAEPENKAAAESTTDAAA